MLTSKNVVINAATVVLTELIVYNGFFKNTWGLLLKVEGQVPHPSHDLAKFGCHRFCGSVDIKFSVFHVIA